jgi:hypothetical protein
MPLRLAKKSKARRYDPQGEYGNSIASFRQLHCFARLAVGHAAKSLMALIVVRSNRFAIRDLLHSAATSHHCLPNSGNFSSRREIYLSIRENCDVWLIHERTFLGLRTCFAEMGEWQNKRHHHLNPIRFVAVRMEDLEYLYIPMTSS